MLFHSITHLFYSFVLPLSYIVHLTDCRFWSLPSSLFRSIVLFHQLHYFSFKHSLKYSFIDCHHISYFVNISPYLLFHFTVPYNLSLFILPTQLVIFSVTMASSGF